MLAHSQSLNLEECVLLRDVQDRLGWSLSAMVALTKMKLHDGVYTKVRDTLLYLVLCERPVQQILVTLTNINGMLKLYRILYMFRVFVYKSCEEYLFHYERTSFLTHFNFCSLKTNLEKFRSNFFNVRSDCFLKNYELYCEIALKTWVFAIPWHRKQCIRISTNI